MLSNLRRMIVTCYPPTPGRVKTYSVGVLEGDGIGPEVMNSALRVLEHINAPLSFDHIQHFDVDNEKLITQMKGYDAIMKGTIQHLIAEGAGSPNMRLRKKLDVFANVMHAFTIDGIPTRHNNIDLIVVR